MSKSDVILRQISKQTHTNGYCEEMAAQQKAKASLWDRCRAAITAVARSPGKRWGTADGLRLRQGLRSGVRPVHQGARRPAQGRWLPGNLRACELCYSPLRAMPIYPWSTVASQG